MEKHERHLTKRDRDILDFLARYRAGITPMFQQLYFDPEDTVANVSRVLRRLERRGLLRSHDSDGLRYFVLTRRGLGTIGLTPRTPRSLTEQSLPVVLAVAAYCVRNGLRRLSNDEFKRLYPKLWKPGLRSSCYILVDTNEGLKLEMILVDRGGAARRIRSRVRRVIAQRSCMPSFVALMKAGRFRITVLTGGSGQEAKIAQQINRESFEPIEVRTKIVAELASVLTLSRR